MPPHPGSIELMARDLVDEETDIASDYNMETSSASTSSSTSSLSNMNQIPSDRQDCKTSDLNPDTLLSIEELTRNVQDLTEQDLLVSSRLDCLTEKSHGTENLFDDRQGKENKNTNHDSEKLDELKSENDISQNCSDISANKTCDMNSNQFQNKVDKRDDDTLPHEEIDSHQEIDNIENTVALQEEIENLLAPLSKEVSITGNGDCKDNISKEHLIEKEISKIGDFIENNDPKKHNVTPTNTKTDFSEACKKDDAAVLINNDSYIQSEKRARLGSISDSSSSCSSSPFELCEAEEEAVVIEHHAVIEVTSSGMNIEKKIMIDY